MKLIRVNFFPDVYQNIYDLSLLKIKNFWLFQNMIYVRKGLGWRDYIPLINISLGGDKLLRTSISWFRVIFFIELFAHDWKS